MAAVKKRKAAGKAAFGTNADTMHIITSVGADVDLLDVAGKPKSSPQWVEIHNLDDASDAVVVLTPEKGANVTVTVPAQPSQPVIVRHPIKAIVASGSSGSPQIICYWWDGSLDWNPEA